jgi:hypothetical protein
LIPFDLAPNGVNLILSEIESRSCYMLLSKTLGDH